MKNLMTVVGTTVVMGSMGFSAYTLWNMKNKKCNKKCSISSMSTDKN